MNKTDKMEWWDRSWNVMTGCTSVSPACDNCYAAAMSKRFDGHFNVTLHPERLEAPMHWKKPQFVFVCNMGDLFHEYVPFEFIDKVFAVMALCPQHTFAVLTKRVEKMARYIQRLANHCTPLEEYARSIGRTFQFQGMPLLPWPLPNVGLMTTVENQKYADERISVLLGIPAAWHGVSYEPSLGPIVFTEEQLKKLSWCVCGGESGPHARPMNPQWARDTRDQCKAAGVSFWFKSWGEWSPNFSKHKGNVKEVAICQNGECSAPLGWSKNGWHLECSSKHPILKRIGKRAAGRLLDGVEWLQRPERSEVTK
jgi:protein gp37